MAGILPNSYATAMGTAFGNASPMDAITNGLLNFNPAAAAPIYQRQLLEAAMQNPEFARQLSIFSNPKLQENLYGINNLGELKAGPVSAPVIYNNGQPTSPISGGLPALLSLGQQAAQGQAAATAYGTAQGQNQQALDAQGATTPPPTAAGQPNTAYAGSPIPPNVNPAKFREAEAARVAEANKDLRAKGEGSIDFLPDAERVLAKIQSGQYNDAIGPTQGSPWYNQYIRGPLNNFSSDANKGLGEYNQLSADLQRLTGKNLKAQFGSRISNVEIGINRQTFGGAQSSDPQTAANILSERVRAAYENLQRAVDARVMDPRSIPADVVQRGVDAGYLNPQSFGAQPSQPSQAQPQTRAPAFTQDQLRAEAIRRGLIKP